LFGRQLAAAGGAAGNSALESVGDIYSATSAYGGRNALAAKYGITESSFDSFVAACCCRPCAQVQEVNTVMVREGLHYGCASLEKDVLVVETQSMQMARA